MFYAYKDKVYPSYLKQGKAANFVFPFAKQFCIGDGLDIGGTEESHFPGTQIINLKVDDEFHAMNLPKKKYDFIFSSHTLEHVSGSEIEVLKYWKEHLKTNGFLFLYLPHYDMEYWRPQNNKKHKHTFGPMSMKATLEILGFSNVLCSERDLYWSFSVIGINI